MKTATVRDLRNHFHKLEAWLAEGESIEIRRRRQTVAILSRPGPEAPAPGAGMPDFAARRKALGSVSPLTREQLKVLAELDVENQQG